MIKKNINIKFCVLLLISCGLPSFVNSQAFFETDIEKSDLHGKVKKIVEKKYRFSELFRGEVEEDLEENSDYLLIKELFFNQNGYLDSIIDTDSRRSHLPIRTLYLRDSFQNLTNNIVYRGNSMLWSEVEYRNFYKNGQLVKSISSNEKRGIEKDFVREYSYENGEYKMTTYSSSQKLKTQKVYIYDKQGNYLRFDGSLGFIECQNIYKYDETGELSEIESKTDEGDVVCLTQYFQVAKNSRKCVIKNYNTKERNCTKIKIEKQGKLLNSKSISSCGAPLKSKYLVEKYDYDEQGNWVFKSVKYQNSFSIYLRNIEYY